MNYIKFSLLLAILWSLLSFSPVYAGDPPGGVIGPMNPTMFRCVEREGIKTSIDTTIIYDPFIKDPTIIRVVEKITYVELGNGAVVSLNQIEEYLRENPDIQRQSCTIDIDFDYGFDTKDAVLFNNYLEDLKRECSDKDGYIVPIRDTRIEGTVYEFHPADPNNPAESEWIGAPSYFVPVVIEGITFEEMAPSDDKGNYFFPTLGAGPIVLNLRLPPDAHPVNPDVAIFSTGLEETWTVLLGYYRGDVPPPNITELRTPEGNYLPFFTLADYEKLAECGYTGLPSLDSTGETNAKDIQKAAMPSVGGIIPADQALAPFILALVLVIGLPAAGIFTLKQR